MKTDPDDPDVGIRRWKVGLTGNNGPGFYYASDPHDMPSPDPGMKRRGVGHLHTQATDEIRERIDLDEHVGDVVATVTVDVDAWEYRIDWEIDGVEETETPFLDRLYRYLRSHAGWEK